ncbi:MAG: response regulator [Methanobacteriaceae archaeon]|jgi:CheY-like chemotaxis protein
MTKILIVEDGAIIAENIKNRLENMNYSVSRIVSNGRDAIKCVSELDIDLILMGVMLKGDIDGIETAKK